MDCKQWNETWVAHLYDECSAEEREVIEAHLAGCESCREQMDSLAATRDALAAGATEIAAPPRVIVLPAAPRRTPAWSFAGGFAAAAAMFAFGIFVGMGWISTQPQPQAQPIELVQTDRGPDLSDPEATDRYESDPGYLQIRNEYERLDNRVNRIESWLPESQGEARPALATMDRVQTAVGDLHQQFDLRRSQDLQFFVEWILATDQDSRIRDARTLQALGLVHAENNPNVRQR